MASVRVALLVVLALCVPAGVLSTRPPPVVPADAPPGTFSAARASRHLEWLARAPHPAGTAEHARVRDALVRELASLGLAPEVQRTTAVHGEHQCAGTVHNVVARLEGTRRGSAVLLVAHYDTKAPAPGAGDDAAAVAALLETARALKAGPPLASPVVFLFTDGEEDGLLGASAFVREHPWARSIGVVLNFEARGTSGPTLLFETGDGDGPLVRAFGAACARPLGTSLASVVYRYMPNDTDFSVFRSVGLPGLNFAFAGDWDRYHTPQDDRDRLDLRSLQHHGDHALALARALAPSLAADLPAGRAAPASGASGTRGLVGARSLRGEPSVFFDVAGLAFIAYPCGFAAPLAAAVAGLWLAAALAGRRHGWFTWGSLAGAALACAGSSVLAAAAGLAIRWVVSTGHGTWLEPGDWLRCGPYAGAVAAMALAIAIGTAWLTGRIIASTGTAAPVPALAMGALLIWLGLAGAAAIALPEASYLFTWPAALALPATVLAHRGAGRSSVPDERSLRSRAGELASMACSAAPVLLVLSETGHHLFQGLGLSPVCAPLLAGVAALASWTLIPHFAAALLRRWWVVAPIAGLLVAPALLALGAARTRYTREHPEAGQLLYVMDTGTGKAFWVASGDRPDAWAARVFGAPPRHDPLADDVPGLRYAARVWCEAPAADLSAPVVGIVSDVRAGDTRTVRLRIVSRRGARVMSVSVTGVEVVRALVDGRPLARPEPRAKFRMPGAWYLEYSALPADGFELTLVVRPRRAPGLARSADRPLRNGPHDERRIRLDVVDWTEGPPRPPGVPVPPPPPSRVPVHRGDLTLVRQTHEI
jgi:hypothetical protein